MIKVTYSDYGDGYDNVLLNGEWFGIIGSDDDMDDYLNFKDDEHDTITTGDFSGLLIDFLPEDEKDEEDEEDEGYDDEIPADDDERWIEAYHAFIQSKSFQTLRDETVTEGLIKIGKVKSADEITFA